MIVIINLLFVFKKKRFRLAKGIYWIDIQADMKVFTYGYNYLLSKPCRLWDDIFAVSGRCCHQWSNHSIGMGKMTGHQMEHRLKHTDDNNNEPFYISETINRGPLLFVGHRLKELDYLDDDNFILVWCLFGFFFLNDSFCFV